MIFSDVPCDKGSDLMGNFAFGTVNQLVILVHNRSAPSDLEWDSYVDYIRRNLPTRGLVVTDGGAPTAPQRQAITPFTRPDARIAVLTTSAFARGVVTALAWFRPTVYRAFPPNHLEDALSYLGIGRTFMPEVTRKVASLQASLKA